MHHKIAVLEENIFPTPNFNIPPPHTAEISIRESTQPDELIEAIKDATIVITVTPHFTREILSTSITPNLQFIAQVSAGYDNIDCEAAKERGIKVSNTPGTNVDTVSGHALALYFATRRKVLVMHNIAVTEQWTHRKAVWKNLNSGSNDLPLTPEQEIVGIIGGSGKIGRKIASQCSALGMRVMIAARKSDGESIEFQPDKTSFVTVLKQATVLFVVIPLTDETRNLISKIELETMKTSAVVINIGRGGIINEYDLANALIEKKIAGAATDVFAKEPATKESSPLLTLPEEANFIASPHCAWYSGLTEKNSMEQLAMIVESFIAGHQENIIV